MKQNKIYKESYLIRMFLKDFNDTYNTDETLNCYNSHRFGEYLKNKGFIDLDVDLWLYNKELTDYIKKLELFKITRDL